MKIEKYHGNVQGRVLDDWHEPAFDDAPLGALPCPERVWSLGQDPAKVEYIPIRLLIHETMCQSNVPSASILSDGSFKSPVTCEFLSDKLPM